MRKARKREESESLSATGWFCNVRAIRVCGSVATCHCLRGLITLAAVGFLLWAVGLLRPLVVARSFLRESGATAGSSGISRGLLVG